MNFGQFFLGLVTIMVATVVYRWQKAVDRQTDLIRERRVVYARYLGAAKKHMLSQPYKGVSYTDAELDTFYNLSSEEADIYCLRDEVYLLCTQGVRTRLVEFDRCFRDWKISFPQAEEVEKVDLNRQAHQKMQAAHFSLIEEMRREIHEDRHHKIAENLKLWASKLRMKVTGK